MKIIELNFKDNTAEYISYLLKEKDFDIFKTLLITPSQRFKNYFASSMLKLHKKEDLISPDLITIEELTKKIISNKGYQIANSIEKLSMIFSAIEKTEKIEELLPCDRISSFNYLKDISSKLLKSFYELNNEKLDVLNIDPGDERFNYYSNFKNHFKLFKDIYRNYIKIQDKEGAFDESFLIKKVTERDIEDYFKDYSKVILASPLSLTRFEKMIFDCLDEKLYVIYQNTYKYDFSNILTYHTRKPINNHKRLLEDKDVNFIEAQSRIQEVMISLSIIREELERGTKPEEIAVINIDSIFCEMLHDSLKSLGLDTNYSEGIPVRKSPVTGFLNLCYNFFKSNLDSSLYLELLKNDIFTKLSGIKNPLDECNTAIKKILKKRVFNIPDLNYFLISDGPGKVKAFKILKKIYLSEDFVRLYQNLNELFSSLGSEKSYEFSIIRDILLNTALELTDFISKVKESAFEIFLQYAGLKRYPVLGDKKVGIQIIGLLETRGINFKTVVVPSFNEGFFPTIIDNDIFLNSDIRKKLKLSTFREKEDLEFYYLKRIIDASDRAYVLSISDVSGEIDIKSRFYYYLKVAENSEVYTLPVKTKSKKLPRYEFSFPSIVNRVDSFSRFDVDKIKKCEIRYYISKILHIAEKEEIVTEIDLSRVGEKVHCIFNDLYRDEDFNKRFFSLNEFEDRLNKLFDDYFKEGFFYTREEVLLKKILKENLLISLKRDVNRFNSGYSVCNEFIEKDLTASIGDENNYYTLNGRIDRVDKTPDNSYIIIDYKTGRYPDRIEHLKKSNFGEIQLGYYGLLFRKTNPDVKIDGLCYYDLSGINDIRYIINKEEIDDYLCSFEDHLLNFLNEFNEKKYLALTCDQDNCKYCQYFNICRIFEEVI